MHASNEAHLNLFVDVSRLSKVGACVASLAGNFLEKLLLLMLTLVRRKEVLKHWYQQTLLAKHLSGA